LWDRAAGTKEELKMEEAGLGELVRVHFQQISGIRGILDLIGKERRERQKVTRGVGE
jgi:hypothetical protein